MASLALHDALMRLPPVLGEPFGMTGPGTVPHALVTALVVSSHVVVGSIELMRALKSHLSMKALFGPPDRGFLTPAAGQYRDRRRVQPEQAHLRAEFVASTPQTGAWCNDARGVKVQRGNRLTGGQERRGARAAARVMHDHESGLRFSLSQD